MNKDSSYSSVTFKRVMAYLFMPLLFSILGYCVLYLSTYQFVEYAYKFGSVFISSDVRGFDGELTDIYKPKNTAYPTYEKQPSATFDIEIQRVNVSSVEVPLYNTRYAQLTCEAAEIDAPLYWGDSNIALNNGVGQSVASFLPGRGRPILISGHNGTYFYGLRNIALGDIVTIQTNYGLYQYEVFEIKIARYDDASAYDLLADEETLIMYTCYPHDLLSYTKNERKFVYARKVIGPQWDWT